jgi:sugar phosphate permease
MRGKIMSNQNITAKNSFFYGWWIVGFALISLIITNGSTIGGLPVFFKPMLDELQNLGAITDVTRPQVTAFGGAVTLYTVAFFVIPIGYLIDKVNLKILISVGCVLLGIGLIIYSQAVSPTYIYIAHAFFGIALCCAGSLVNSILVSNWFKRKRGLAMGIIYTGTSFGGALIPLVATPLIAKYGWRLALLGVSGLVFALLPLVWLIVRVKPSEKGLLPDGDLVSEIEIDGKMNEATSGLTLKEALKSPVFWIFAIADMCVFWAIFVVVQQSILYLQSPAIGMTKESAAASLATMGFSSIGGKFLFGWLSDRLPRRLVFLGCCGLLFLASLVLFSLSMGNVMWFLIPFGIAYGGIFVCAKLVTIELFGLCEAGKIMGVITFVETIGSATGLALTGIIASKYGGDYVVAFYPVIAVTFIAFFGAIIVSRLQTRVSLENSN